MAGKIQVTDEVYYAIKKAAERQKIHVWGASSKGLSLCPWVGSSAKHVKLSVEVSLLAETPQNYRVATDTEGRLSFGKSDPRFEYKRSGAILMITGRFEDLRKRKLL